MLIMYAVVGIIVTAMGLGMLLFIGKIAFFTPYIKWVLGPIVILVFLLGMMTIGHKVIEDINKK